MKHLVFAISLLTLCHISVVVSAMPLSMMSQEQLQALPDAVLEENGRHRVKPGETTWSLAQKAGLSVNAFHWFNSDAYQFDWDPERLSAGAIVKVGKLVESTKVIEACTFGGRHSIHEYEFCGCSDCSDSSLVQVCWSIEWPEEGCGLLPSCIKRLRMLITSQCLGEEVETITDKIEEAKNSFRQKALAELNPNTAEIYHWEFSTRCKLSWPFGMKGEEDKWYQRPVIVLANSGNEYYGGNRCTYFFRGYIVSIPDGVVLTERDYFREDALEDVAVLVGKRMVETNGGDLTNPPKVRTGKDCWLTLSEEGMTWWLAPGALFHRDGGTDVTIPWDELEPFAR